MVYNKADTSIVGICSLYRNIGDIQKQRESMVYDTFNHMLVLKLISGYSDGGTGTDTLEFGIFQNDMHILGHRPSGTETLS